MSRIGKKLIPIVEGVKVEVKEGLVDIKGTKGEDTIKFDPNLITVEVEDAHIKVSRLNEEKHTKQLHGTIRALINNAVVGVSQGYSKILEIIGIGYHADMAGKDVILTVGYSHPVKISPVEGVTIKVLENKSKDINSIVEVSGSDKFKVGQVAAQIREVRKPEPYKGKGIRYRGEYILRKEGKRAGK